MTNNAFSEVLNVQRKGECLNELSAALQTIVQGVKEHKAKCSLTLKISVAPANGDASAVSVIDEIEIKVPKVVKASSLFFSTDENTLVRKDPNQKEMQLDAVETVPVAIPTAKAKAA